MLLPKRFADEMVKHARAEAPNECCGLLAGKNGAVLEIFQCQSAEKSPYRYYLDPKDQLRIMQEMDRKGWDLLGIYHSHTHTEAYPSKTDVELALYPEALYFIISLKDRHAPVIRAFRITDGQIAEEGVEVR